MHDRDASIEALTDAIVRYAVDRVGLDPPPLDRPRTAEELRAAAGITIRDEGIGGPEALRVFTDVLAPACISTDHPRFLAFVPAAPTVASVLFDLLLGASSIYAGSWLEGAGAIFAENEALRWIADLAGFPESAGGVFVSGGTAGNLSALLAARAAWRRRADGRFDRTRGTILASAGAHSSVVQAARAMDADVIEVDPGPEGRLTRAHLNDTLGSMDADVRALVMAVVATGGTTNAGVIDDLVAAADAADLLDTWLHVDGAYGGAGLAAPSVRDRFHGVERADSFIVDPHKWLFAPYDSCALIYREPALARAAHTQQAEYLDVLHGGVDEAASAVTGSWNASDYAHHLSRRARGMPLWFSLATHGTNAYRDAVEETLRVTRAAAELLRRTDHTDLLLEPELSVVVFRRVGWSAEQYQAWSDAELAAGHSFVVPTSWDGAPALRLCIVNPRTTVDDIASIVDSLVPEPVRITDRGER